MQPDVQPENPAASTWQAAVARSVLPSYKPWPASSARSKCATPRRLVSPIATPTSRGVPGRSTRSESGGSSGGGCSSCGSGSGRQHRSSSPLHTHRQTLRSPVTDAELQLVSTFVSIPSASTRRSPVRAQPAPSVADASPPRPPHPLVVTSPDIEQHVEQNMCSSRCASSHASPNSVKRRDIARDPTLRRGDQDGVVSVSACKDVLVFGVALMLIFLVVLGLATGEILPGLLPWMLIGLPLALMLLSSLGAQRAFSQFADALGWQLGCCDRCCCLTLRSREGGHQRVVGAAGRALTLE